MFPKLDAHAEQSAAMAARAGCDLEEAISAADLSAADYRALVLRCCTCRQADECRSHLAHAVAARGAVPDYCLNKDLFGALAAAPSPHHNG